MSITDELREWARNHVAELNISGVDERDLNGIADRIDAAVGGMVELPKDADGVPIHVGDVMELSLFDVSYNPAITVYGIGAGVFFSFDAKLGKFAQRDANAYRHVKPDSWDHIIEDAAKLARGDNAAVIELVERCRRLAGEA